MAAARNITALPGPTRIRCSNGNLDGLGLGANDLNNHHGMIGLTPVAALSSNTDSGKWLLSWQTYSQTSVPSDHRRLKPLDHGFVYAPGSSKVTSYFRVLASGREKRSVK